MFHPDKGPEIHPATNKKLIKTVIFFLLLGLILTKADDIIYMIWPSTATQKMFLFLDQSYYSEDHKITILWYVYELMAIADKVIWCIVISLLAYKYSYRLFLIGVVFFVYNGLQLYFYMLNRNTTYWANRVLILFLIAAIFLWIVPIKKKVPVRKLTLCKKSDSLLKVI
jgi:hypothetical protein